VKLWTDWFPSSVPEELANAKALGVKPIKIISPDSVAGIGANGRLFKWVLTKEGELLGLPSYNKGDVVNGKVVDKDDVIKHSVATGGEPVRAAGDARLVGKKIFVDRHSGHYRPDQETLRIAKDVFQAAGFRVATVEDGVE